MNKLEFKQLIRECIAETLKEETNQAPGLHLDLQPTSTLFQYNELDEANDVNDLGANLKNLPQEKIQRFLNLRKEKSTLVKRKTEEKNTLSKEEKSIINNRIKEIDDILGSAEFKYQMPFVHGGNLEYIDINGKVVDVDAFKKLISVRPAYLIGQNSKMVKSGKEGVQVFYNTSLPAFRGLILDEKTNELKVVNTCPGAGSCINFCYAKKGGFVQYKDVSLRQTRILNFLFNDWQGYKDQMLSEINALVAKHKKGNEQINLRWNDSGDMLSQKYLQIVMDIAKATPEVNHYAYSKQVGMIKSIPNVQFGHNFTFNFSKGGLPKQDALITDKDKKSIVVPYQLVDDYMKKVDQGKGVSKHVYKDKQSEQIAKQKIASKYGVDINTLKTVDEINDLPVGEKDQYNVIVLQGESDVSASRKDVKNTFLILH